MTRAAIKHAEARLREAVLASDVDALDALLDDALIFCMPNGAVLRKEDDLEGHRSGKQKITRFDARELLIELHDHAAVVCVRVDLEGTYAGQPIDGAYRYTRTYVRKGEDWKIVAGHVAVITS